MFLEVFTKLLTHAFDCSQTSSSSDVTLGICLSMLFQSSSTHNSAAMIVGMELLLFGSASSLFLSFATAPSIFCDVGENPSWVKEKALDGVSLWTPWFGGFLPWAICG